MNRGFLKYSCGLIGLLLALAASLCYAQESEQTWPIHRDGLLFAFSTVNEDVFALDAQGIPIPGYGLKPRGLAHTDYAERMVLPGGAYVAQDTGNFLRDRIIESQAFSLEMTLILQTTREKKLRWIAAFGASAEQYNFILAQRGNKLLFALNTKQENNAAPNWVNIASLCTDCPVHIVLTYADGRLTAFQDSLPLFTRELAVDFSGWSPGELIFGDAPEGQFDWAGTLEGIALYNRALTPKEVVTHARTYGQMVDQRNPPPLLKVAATLVGKSLIPKPEDLAPYTEALVVFEYRVDEILEGSYEGKTVYAAHWIVLDDTFVPFKDTPLQEKVELHLQPFEAVPGLDTRYLSDTIVEDFALPLFYDAGGLSLDMNDASDPALHVSDEGVAQVELTNDVSSSSLGECGTTLRDFQVAMRERLRKQDPTYWGVTGLDGFLFHRASVNYVSRSADFVLKMAKTEHGPVVVLSNFSEQLKRRGIHMLFVPVPDKAEIYPDKLSEIIPKEGCTSLYTNGLIQVLRSAGVDVLDLYPAFLQARSENTDPIFIPTDTHWADAAIQVAAARIAEHLRDAGLDDALGNAPEKYSTKPFEVQVTGDIASRGISEADLINYPASTVTLERVVDEQGRRYNSVQEAPVLLAGDSFVGKFSPAAAGVGAHIAKELGRPISELYGLGGGSDVPRKIARNGPEFLKGRKVVIWLMGARYLVPSKKWKITELP